MINLQKNIINKLTATELVQLVKNDKQLKNCVILKTQTATFIYNKLFNTHIVYYKTIDGKTTNFTKTQNPKQVTQFLELICLIDKEMSFKIKKNIKLLKEINVRK